MRAHSVLAECIRNRAGNFVSPDLRSFQVVASSADWNAATDFCLVLTDAPGEDAYPITATTFLLMHKRPISPERSAIALDFVRWSLESGKSEAELLNDVPLPPAPTAVFARISACEGQFRPRCPLRACRILDP
jgi:phosphate transport system substrate-binding protein